MSDAHRVLLLRGNAGRIEQPIAKGIPVACRVVVGNHSFVDLKDLRLAARERGAWPVRRTSDLVLSLR